MSGWHDVPLDEVGRAQARRVAVRLQGVAAHASIWSSPLTRAAATAAAIAGSLPVLLEPDLREISCGLADGLPIAEVQARFAEAWAANLRQQDDDFRWPRGESYRQLRYRALAAIHRIAAGSPTPEVIVVTHAGVINQIVGEIVGTSPADWSRFRPANASVTTLGWANGVLAVWAYDDHAHLDAPCVDDSSPRDSGGKEVSHYDQNAAARRTIRAASRA